MTTWRKEIERALFENNEEWASIVSCTLSDKELDCEFDSGYGGVNGKNFTLWTKNHVYFPCSYDGAEWCDSVPRNPNGKKTCHKGGG